MDVLAAETDAPWATLVWFFAVMTALSLLILAGQLIRKRRRVGVLQQFAQQHGLTYTDRDDAWAEAELAAPRRRGGDHSTQEILTGRYRDHDIAYFTHTFTTGSGDTQSTHYGTVTAIVLPVELPLLRVERSTPDLDRIKLESEQFNQIFKVTGDRRLAYDILHPRMMQWLLDTDAPGFVINRRYLAHVRWGMPEITRIDRDLDYVFEVEARIPGFVFDRRP